MGNNLAFAQALAEVDNSHELAAQEEVAHEDALNSIIDAVLAGENVRFSDTEEWTLEELLLNYLKVPSRKLDSYIKREQEGMH